jgi:hypothetical protein
VDFFDSTLSVPQVGLYASDLDATRAGKVCTSRHIRGLLGTRHDDIVLETVSRYIQVYKRVAQFRADIAVIYTIDHVPPCAYVYTENEQSDTSTMPLPTGVAATYMASPNLSLTSGSVSSTTDIPAYTRIATRYASRRQDYSVTAQLIIAADRKKTYAIYNYDCINWPRHLSVNIGATHVGQQLIALHESNGPSDDSVFTINRQSNVGTFPRFPTTRTNTCEYIIRIVCIVLCHVALTGNAKAPISVVR